MGRLDNTACSEWAFNNPIFGIIPPLTFLIGLICCIIVGEEAINLSRSISEMLFIWAVFAAVCIYFGLSPDRRVRRLIGVEDRSDLRNVQIDPRYYARQSEPRKNKHPKWITLRGTAFELWLIDLYRQRGYKVTHTGGQRDHDADLLLEKDGRKIVVQAKGYKDTVRKDAVNEAHAAQSIYRADEAWVVTNSYFTDYAKEHADGCHVRLYDRNDLDRYLRTGRQYRGHRHK